ncbi:MAG: PDZ domain-containing protein [Planctomycetota bacterium]
MRRIRKAALLTLLAVLLLSTPLSAQRRREPPWDTHTTTHYRIKYSCTAAEAALLGQWMEFVHNAYCYLIKVKTQDKHVIKLFRDRKQWVEYGQPPGAGAYYTLTTKQLVGFYDRRAVFPFFAHEGMHQFMHIAVPGMQKLIPTWLSEGLADCMGSSKVIKKQFRWCLFNALIAEGRSYVIKKALREGTAIPLTRLFKLNHREFMQNAKLHYAQSWSFTHFLFCAPHVELPKKVIPNGKHKKAIVVYLDLLRKGEVHDKAWEEALKKINMTQEALEAEWKEYVLNTLPETGPQDDDAYLGVRTQESKKGGMEVLMVVKDGPAEKGGLQKGDRIIYINKKKLKKQETFTAELKKCKPGDEAEVVVMRGRKKVTLMITLGRRGDFDKDKPEKKG